MRPVRLIDGRYEVIGLLGRGGFGEVLQARDVETGRLIAIKSVTPPIPAVPADETFDGTWPFLSCYSDLG